jgi:hypothetical protein
MLDSDRPLEALWPLLRTWTDAVCSLPGDAPAPATWIDVMSRLGLWGEAFAARQAALDAYLDQVEELLEDWARANGA